MATDFQFDVFISHARKDYEPFVAQLDGDLRAAGLTTWIDRRGIDPAQDFTAEIERAIKASRFVVACISPDVVERDNSFVRREIQYALLSKRPVLVARLYDVLPPIHIVDNTFFEYFRNWDTAHAALLDALGHDPAAYPTPAPPQHDPFRPYLEELYNNLLMFLEQRVIRPIELRSEPTEGMVKRALPSSPPPLTLQRLFQSGGFGDVPVAESAPLPPTFPTFADAAAYYDERLLLLGAPGAGKTVTLLTYARDAVARRLENPNAPLPLLGTVATWDARNRTPLHTWLAEDYATLDAVALERAVEVNETLLLFDGLDELGMDAVEHNVGTGETKVPDPVNPAKTIKEISEFIIPTHFDPRARFLEAIPTQGHVIITCRVEEYRDIGQQAALNGAVTLLPLTEAQIRAYLEELPDLLAAVESDPELHEIVSTPLLMSLVAFSYRDYDEAQARHLRDLQDSPAELVDEIFRAYVDGRYEWELLHQGLSNPPQFSLEEVYTVLGKVAFHNAGADWPSNDNILTEHDFEFHLDTEHVSDFVAFAAHLHLLTRGSSETWRFVHLLLRDYFAFPIALQRLEYPQYTGERRVAMDALQHIDRLYDVRATSAFTMVLHDRSRLVVNRAIDALVHIGGDAVLSLSVALQYPVLQVRRSVAIVLGQIADSRTVDSLVVTLSDSDAWTREVAADSLGQIADFRAVDPLIAALGDSELLVRRAAAHALGQIADLRAIDPLITALDDSDSLVRHAVARALGQIADPCVTVSLITMLDDSDFIVRSAAAEALEQIGTPEALAALDSWRADNPNDV